MIRQETKEKRKRTTPQKIQRERNKIQETKRREYKIEKRHETKRGRDTNRQK